ncbi:MAG: GyrI-like domain-containing protein [Bacteroidota bacterium]
MQRILYGAIGLLVVASIGIYLLPSHVMAEDFIIITGAPQQSIFLQVSKEENMAAWLPQGSNCTITDFKPVSLVVGRMNYDGLDGKSVWRFEKANNGVKVDWKYDASLGSSPMARLAGWNKQRQIKSDIKASLEKLRGVCERQNAGLNQAMQRTTVGNTGLEVYKIQYPATDFVICRKRINMREMPGHFANYFPLIYSTAQTSGLVVNGNPTALFYDWDEQGGIVDVAAAIPVRAAQDLDKEMVAFKLPAKKAVQVEFKGNPENISKAHIAINQYMSQNGLVMVPPTVEEYISDPNGQEDPSKTVTKVTAFYE